MRIFKSLRRVVAAMLLAIGLVALPLPAGAAVNPMPPYTKAAYISAAEQYNIMHLYYTGPKVRLTFDDCATQARLTGLLNWLKFYNTQGIFFFTGQCMQVHPTFRAQIAAAGQLLGNHSFDHAAYSLLNYDQIFREIRTPGSIVPTTAPVKLCRLPYGDGTFNVRVYNVLANAGCRPAFWTVDTRDWDGSSAATIINRVQWGDYWTPRVYPGGVILMHGTGLHTLEALTGVRNALIYWGLATFHIR